MAISFLSQDNDFKISNPRKVKAWLKEIILSYNYRIGEINIIFCSDEVIIDINTKYLKHNYYTDVITFPYTEGRYLSSDIYISIPTVTSNAKKFKQIFSDELLRVIVHAILHLVGFTDNSPLCKQEMTESENIWLTKISLL